METFAAKVVRCGDAGTGNVVKAFPGDFPLDGTEAQPPKEEAAARRAFSAEVGRVLGSGAAAALPVAAAALLVAVSGLLQLAALLAQQPLVPGVRRPRDVLPDRGGMRLIVSIRCMCVCVPTKSVICAEWRLKASVPARIWIDVRPDFLAANYRIDMGNCFSLALPEHPRVSVGNLILRSLPSAERNHRTPTLNEMCLRQ